MHGFLIVNTLGSYVLYVQKKVAHTSNVKLCDWTHRVIEPVLPLQHTRLNSSGT